MSTVSGVSHQALQYAQLYSKPKSNPAQAPAQNEPLKVTGANNDKAVSKEGNIGTKLDTYA